MPTETTSDSVDLQRLRERVELQYNQLETLRAAFAARGVSRTVTVTPQLPPRSSAAAAGGTHSSVTAWWPGSQWPIDPLVPTPGLGSLSLAGRKVTVIAVVVFGLVGAELESLVAMIATRQRRSADFKPVFLTDCPSFRPFQARGFVVEYLPSSIYGVDPHRLKNARGAARIRLLQSKWDFGSVIDLTRNSKSGQAPVLEGGFPAEVEPMAHDGGPMPDASGDAA